MTGKKRGFGGACLSGGVLAGGRGSGLLMPGYPTTQSI